MQKIIHIFINKIINTMQTINKTEALKRLTSLENEAKELRAIIDAPVEITERIKTLLDACEVTGKNYTSIVSINDKYEQAEEAIKTFAEALREGKPASECWYYPYFNRSSGGGFSYDGCDVGGVCSCVGARLRVDTGKKARHLGECMLEYYKTYINGK